MAATRQTTAQLQQDLAARRQQHAQQQPLVEQFLAIYLESLHRVLDAITLVEEGRIELFRHGETVGAVIAEPGLEGVPASYRILQQDHCHQQFFTPYPDSHHDTLRLHGALVQGEVSFSRCISSYCTTGWRLPPLLYLSIIVTFIDMNNRAARPLILHAARPLTLCINGVYISAALERIDTTT